MQDYIFTDIRFTNDSVVTELVSVMEKDTCGKFVKENRGKPRMDIINREPTVKHIESYNPCISHYRRKNAPNIRYLPRELTVKSMFNDFLENNQNNCDLETYKSMLKRLNISLNQPKADECEDCFNFQQDPLIVDEKLLLLVQFTKIKQTKLMRSLKEIQTYLKLKQQDITQWICKR